MPALQRPTNELRRFGVVVGGVFLGIGLWPWVLYGTGPRFWALGVGTVLNVLGAVFPDALKPLHKGWMFIGHILGWINTRVILGLFFYTILTPMGMLARMLGKDFMYLRPGANVETYRIVKTPRASIHFHRLF